MSVKRRLVDISVRSLISSFDRTAFESYGTNLVLPEFSYNIFRYYNSLIGGSKGNKEFRFNNIININPNKNFKLFII